ncbi:hypothetical protein LCGC14_2615280 [marine sediment metagenome]|uniref:Uncharacterized protein n=1 Tax=marine sediment metagenome TaxID=412755 RepID=A0A0F9CXC8_9ZZZZ
MSFRCELCNRSMPAHVKPIRLVMETRRKVYPERMLDKKVFDIGGVGFEIVKEVNACKKCVTRKSETQRDLDRS